MESVFEGVALAAGAILVVLILRDAFEVIVLPRRLSGRVRISRGYYKATWWPIRRATMALKSPGRRETILSYYGPLWMITLIGLWAGLMILAFGMVHWGLGSSEVLARGKPGFWNDIYISGTTLFTLGMGDVYPSTPIARLVAVMEAGIGLGFLALVIGYLPVLYGSFSRREVFISLFDSRAGSPPTASEFLRRYARNPDPQPLRATLLEFERWTAEILESHLSYPVLAWYRSQHERQSWLAAITVILDVSAILLAMPDPRFAGESRVAFAMARHTIIDLAETFSAGRAPWHERLPDADFERLYAVLEASNYPLPEHGAFRRSLDDLRGSYEQHVADIGAHLILQVPGWLPEAGATDDWQTGLTQMHQALP
ncbi:MAG: potassium channel family protein [bacterium]